MKPKTVSFTNIKIQTIQIKTIKEDVATLNDGLKFKGDKGDSIAKKLNEELEILGKLDPNADVTDKNLRVDNDAGS